jgi:HD-like signal output (HDOD) protein
MATLDESSSNPADPGRQTLARIRLALDSGRSASITQIVELIREVTCKFETIPVQGLGEVIGRDLLTMSRVISVAHTLGYNPEGVEISTINQAIHVIGFNKIRNLALSLMLLQSASSEAMTEKRNAAAFALVGGLVAQAVRARQRPEDSEEAFVCATLRSYGRIMLANFLPGEYREALLKAKTTGEDAACRQAFGLTCLELSAALLGQSRMPRNIMIGLRQVARAERSSASLPAELELPVVADFAEELCRLADEPALEANQFRERAIRLVHLYRPNVGLSEEELFEVLEEVAGTLNMFGALQPGHALNSRLLQRFKALAFRLEPLPPSPTSPQDSPPPVTPQSTTSQTSRIFRDPLAAGIAALIELQSRATPTLDEAYSVALRSLHLALELDQSIVFRRRAGTSRYFAWKGLGDFFAVVNGEDLLDAGVRDVFSVCLKRGEDVLIQNPADPKIKPFIPDWLRPSAGAHPMVLLPVRDDRRTITVVCGLRAGSGSFTLTARQGQQLKALRARLVQFETRLQEQGETAGVQTTA